MKVVCVFACIATAFASGEGEKTPPKLSNKDLVAKYSVKITSTKDNTEQDALFYCPPEADPKNGTPQPLLVGLHTWSTTFTLCTKYLPDCQKRKWIMVAPNFRGGNSRPAACASELAIQDVLDAVEYAKKHARVDETRIYLTGASGGGHMALMMAAKAPGVWAAVSAWVPISNLTEWHQQTLGKKGKYDQMLEKCCGGAPGPTTEAEYRARSPIFHLPNAKELPMDINTGIHDGYTGSVPVSQSLNAFNVLADANGLKDLRISDTDIQFMTAQQKIPDTLAQEMEKDVERKLTVLFRRKAGPVRITVFEGGHQDEPSATFAWLARQQKGQQVNFTVPAVLESLKRKRGSSEEVAPVGETAK